MSLERLHSQTANPCPHHCGEPALDPTPRPRRLHPSRRSPRPPGRTRGRLLRDDWGSRTPGPPPLRSRPYVLPARLAPLGSRPEALTAPNEQKVRLLTSPELLASTRTALVQATDYRSSLASNDAAHLSLLTQDAPTQNARFDISSLVFTPSNDLVSLQDSLLSNHIGGQVIILTANNRLVVQRHGTQAVASQMTVVGASGSLDWSDIVSTTTLSSLLKAGLAREASEEVAVEFADPHSQMILCGAGRIVHRGGLPQFYAVARSETYLSGASLSPENIISRWAVPFIPTLEGLDAALEHLATPTGLPDHAFGSRVAISVVRRYLRTDPGRARDCLELR